MTREEINEDMIKKRQKQMGKMISTRKYQFLILMGFGFFYFFIYRKFLHPKSVMNSVLYHNALKYVKINKTVQKELGTHLQMMTCNGKTYPLFNSCQFDLILFGD
jgi:hypothetical protein